MRLRVQFELPSPITTRAIVAFALCTYMVSFTTASEPVDGFFAPYSTVEVATAETGVLREILVREGDSVAAGDVLLRLDDEVQSALMGIAAQAMESEGRLDAARIEVRLRRQRLTKLQALVSRGSARQEEVERALADAEIAEAQLRGIEEELVIKRLDYQRARIHWERRSVRAATRGVVARVHKEVGEFVGPSDPQLLTIVQLDPLLGVFAVPSDEARQLSAEDKVKIQFGASKESIEGAIEFVSPVIDGKSGTMRVEVRLDNPDRQLLSGDPCSLILARESDESNSILTTRAGGPAPSARSE